MTKPKVYVSRILAEEGLRELREVCDFHMWQESELMPREVQFKLFADCTGLLATTDIKIDREEILRQSDILSLHLPLSEKTAHYIGKDELKQMKPSARVAVLRSISSFPLV